MLTITGRHNEAKVFAKTIEDTAKQQIKELCDCEAYKDSKIRIMPDVHAGAGCTIGTTMTIHDKICPNLVGVDISCGVTTWVIRPDSSISKEQLCTTIDKVIREKVPSGFNAHDTPNEWFEDVFRPMFVNQQESDCISYINFDRASKSIGTLGSGNHYLELGILSDPSERKYVLSVHSGSRNLGKQIADYYQKEAIRLCTDTNVSKDLKYIDRSNHFDNYIKAMDLMYIYANVNREVMLENVVDGLINGLGCGIDVLKSIETVHNYIDLSNPSEMILRKGAVAARKDELFLIPLNMRDGMIIAKGKDNPDWNYSAPHGAGRLYGRNQAKKLLSLDEYKDTMKDVWSSCISNTTLDEAPQAYKPMDEILSCIGDTAEIVNIIKPVYNFKAS